MHDSITPRPISIASFAFLCAVGVPAAFSAPAAQPAAATIHAEQKVLIPVLANNAESAGSPAIEIVQPPQFGTAVPDRSGRILYTNTDASGGGDRFTYRISGVEGASEPAAVTIRISNKLRIPTIALNIPGAPPATSIRLVNALPGLSFDQPLCLVSPPGDTKRLFVCEKTGKVKVVPDVTSPSPAQSVFLDLPALLSSRGEAISTRSEEGLLSIAFHPDYARNRYFYLFYSVRGADGKVYERISRFTAQAENPAAADPSSELVLIDQADRANNHQGGCLEFGPDNYLYIALGDEGAGNDKFNNSQRIDKDFFAAIARIDVDKKPGSLAPNPHPAVPMDGGVARYAIPPDNPFVKATRFGGAAVDPKKVRTEFWAVGLRNPWRFSFDSKTGELWCGDVGQNKWEEVDLIVKGGNYGWAYREASHPGPKPAPANPDAIDPIYEYPRGSGPYEGRSITGGLVYHGTRISSLTGAYVFADYASGNIWSLRRKAAGVDVQRIGGEGSIASFGLDPSNGDLLVANLKDGLVQRFTAGPADDDFPQTLSATGLFADLATLSPSPGVLPYAPNLAFWSDHAIKRRWFAVPGETARIAWSRDGNWTLPTGAVWVKHFDMEMTRGNPATKRRIETRLLVKTAGGAYGVSYRWNDEQTDATLVPDEGAALSLAVEENGVSHAQAWGIPSRASCMVCHTQQAGYVLSFNTRQLNRSENLNGFDGNQIDLLRAGGYFSNTPDPSNALPRYFRPDETSHPLEARVRSYLAVNCAYCHMAGGTAAPAVWDGRPELPLAKTGLINEAAVNNGGDPANKLVVPGNPDHSVLLSRIAATHGFTRMPPLASNELDRTDIGLVREWIQSMARTRPAPSNPPK